MIFTVLASMALASSSAQDAQCKTVGKLARVVMQARQDETPMSKVIEGLVPVGGTYEQMMRDMILEAYGKAGYGSYEYQSLAVDEFGNAWELRCHKAYPEIPKR